MTPFPTRGGRTTVRSALLLLLALSTVAMTYRAGDRLGMSEAVATRHAYYSLPYAVSHRFFGTRGYVILRDVAEVFITTHPHVTNETISKAIALTPSLD